MASLQLSSNTAKMMAQQMAFAAVLSSGDPAPYLAAGFSLDDCVTSKVFN